MDDHDWKRRALVHQIGPDEFRLLHEDIGEGMDSIIPEILAIVQQNDAKRALAARFPTINDYLTSELVYKSGSLDDAFGREYARRLQSIGFPSEDVSRAYAQEKAVMGNGMREVREERWARRRFFDQGTTIDLLPKKEELTLSELILITDDAVTAHKRDRNRLSGEAWDAVLLASDLTGLGGKIHYGQEYWDRIRALGWLPVQDRAYVQNEVLIIKRLKWSYHDDPAWTEATTDLEQYQRIRD